jgi:hypothetical protein
LGASVDGRFAMVRGGTRVLRLSATRVPAGATVIARRCLPARPCVSRRFTAATRIDVTNIAGKRPLPRGAKLEIRITHLERIGMAFTYTMRAKSTPVRKQRTLG